MKLDAAEFTLAAFARMAPPTDKESVTYEVRPPSRPLAELMQSRPIDPAVTRLIDTHVARMREWEDSLPPLPPGYRWDITVGIDPANDAYNRAHMVIAARPKEIAPPCT